MSRLVVYLFCLLESSKTIVCLVANQHQLKEGKASSHEVVIRASMSPISKWICLQRCNFHFSAERRENYDVIKGQKLPRLEVQIEAKDGKLTMVVHNI